MSDRKPLTMTMLHQIEAILLRTRVPVRVVGLAPVEIEIAKDVAQHLKVCRSQRARKGEAWICVDVQRLRKPRCRAGCRSIGAVRCVRPRVACGALRAVSAWVYACAIS